MKTGTVTEAIAIFLVLFVDVLLVIYIITQNTAGVPIVVTSVLSIVSTIFTYIATRLFSFRHNMDRIDLKAIEIIQRHKKKYSAEIRMTDFIASLSAEFGPSTAKIEYEDLEERGIIKTNLSVIKTSAPPKAVKIVDTTWRARLI